MIIHDLELKISKLLRIGVIIAGLVIFTGWAWSVMTSGNDLFHFKDYEQRSLVDSVQVAMDAKDFGTLIVYAGLALLIMLPAARVLFTGVLFIVLKEKILGWTAIAVFTVLVTSFLLGANL